MIDQDPMPDAATRSRLSDQHVSLVPSAEMELGAFLAAVRQKYGPAVVSHAGNYWIEALEAAPSPLRPRDWRQLTIRAASRMAKEFVSAAGCV
jgi:hypothetical protein